MMQVGMRVYYYQQADIHGLPSVAFVTNVGSDSGVLDLNVAQRGGGDMVPKRAIRHFGDPILLGNREQAYRNGAWGPCPFENYLDDEDLDMEDEDVSEIELKLLELSNLGKKSTEIAELMGEGWNYQKVNATLRKLTHEKVPAVSG